MKNELTSRREGGNANNVHMINDESSVQLKRSNECAFYMPKIGFEKDFILKSNLFQNIPSGSTTTNYNSKKLKLFLEVICAHIHADSVMLFIRTAYGMVLAMNKKIQ